MCQTLINLLCKYGIPVLALMLGPVAFAEVTTTVTADAPQEETVITSDQFEMKGGETENYFYFYGNVKVTGTNLDATCEEMEVVANRQAKSDAAVGDVGGIKSIVMKRNVVLKQSGRVAEAGRADIFPREGKVVLSENPKVTDSEGTVTGFRMTLSKGEKKVTVEGDPSGASGGRPTIRLPGFQDLGYEDSGPTTTPIDTSTGGNQ